MSESKKLLQWRVSANNPARIAEVNILSLDEYITLVNLTDPLPWQLDTTGKIVDAAGHYIAQDTIFEYLEKIKKALIDCRQQLAVATGGNPYETDEIPF